MLLVSNGCYGLVLCYLIVLAVSDVLDYEWLVLVVNGHYYGLLVAVWLLFVIRGCDWYLLFLVIKWLLLLVVLSLVGIGD